MPNGGLGAVVGSVLRLDWLAGWIPLFLKRLQPADAAGTNDANTLQKAFVHTPVAAFHSPKTKSRAIGGNWVEKWVSWAYAWG